MPKILFFVSEYCLLNQCIIPWIRVVKRPDPFWPPLASLKFVSFALSPSHPSIRQFLNAQELKNVNHFPAASQHFLSVHLRQRYCGKKKNSVLISCELVKVMSLNWWNPNSNLIRSTLSAFRLSRDGLKIRLQIWTACRNQNMTLIFFSVRVT